MIAVFPAVMYQGQEGREDVPYLHPHKWRLRDRVQSHQSRSPERFDSLGDMPPAEEHWQDSRSRWVCRSRKRARLH